MPPGTLRVAFLYERLLPALTLLLILLYSAANFMAVPYAGLYFVEASGQVDDLFVPGGDLRIGDVLLEVGGEPFAEFQADTGPLPFAGAQPGDRVPVSVRRGEQTLTVEWTYPGFTLREFIFNRLLNQWFLAPVFWAIGTFAVLQLRPRARVQRLFAAFCYLTAVWLIASTISRWHLWFSPMVLRSALWLWVPVTWHLHWAFPQPLTRPARWPGWVVYGLFGLAAVVEWLGLMPDNLYALALLLGAAGSLVLLMIHYFRQPKLRRELGLVAGGALGSLLPTLVLGASTAQLGLGSEIALAGLLALPLLPLGYLLAIARHRLGGLEVRINRALALYLFLVVVLTLVVIAGGLLGAAMDLAGDSVLLAGLAGLAVGLSAIYGYGPFQRLVERRLLGVPPAPSHLLERYASRIATDLETSSLVQLLRHEILPSLDVRQSALLRMEAGAAPSPLYVTDAAAVQLPTAAEAAALLAEAGAYRHPAAEAQVCPWVRLALALRVKGQPAGLWLLGQRDPDDFYAASEIMVLQGLADQTAIALANIKQSELLHTLYQADIDQAETARTGLARELHDGPLQQLNLLRHSVSDHSLPDEFHSRYTATVDGLRRIVTGLRPGMLDYGLHAGLTALADELGDRQPEGPRVALDVPVAAGRYPPHVEQHLFRIVQQACENACQHARAQALKISGRLEPEAIELAVDDDGIGLGLTGPVDLAALAARKHFGLTGMHERAALVGALLTIEARPGGGTRVRVSWAAPRDGMQTPGGPSTP